MTFNGELTHPPLTYPPKNTGLKSSKGVQVMMVSQFYFSKFPPHVSILEDYLNDSIFRRKESVSTKTLPQYLSRRSMTGQPTPHNGNKGFYSQP